MAPLRSCRVIQQQPLMLHFPVCCHDTVTSSSSSTKERIRRRGIGEGRNSYSGLAHLEAGVNWKAKWRPGCVTLTRKGPYSWNYLLNKIFIVVTSKLSLIMASIQIISPCWRRTRDQQPKIQIADVSLQRNFLT